MPPNRGDKKGKVSTCSTNFTPEEIYQTSQKDGQFESPIDIKIDEAVPINLPDILWDNIEDLPRLAKLTNSGHTVILSAKWAQRRPAIRGGPFLGSYVFSQLHFHWGETNAAGSEHAIGGKRYPMEIHAIFYKSSYLTQEEAVLQPDGIVVLCYFLKIQPDDNEGLMEICNNLKSIKEPLSSLKVGPMVISPFLPFFVEDYLLYWGRIYSEFESTQNILWLISRYPVGVSEKQVSSFRSLYGFDNCLLTHNSRETKPTNGRTIYHVNPSLLQDSFLYLLPYEMMLMDARMTMKGPPKKTQGPSKHKQVTVNVQFESQPECHETETFWANAVSQRAPAIESCSESNDSLRSNASACIFKNIEESRSGAVGRPLTVHEKTLLRYLTKVSDYWKEGKAEKIQGLYEFLQFALSVVKKHLNKMAETLPKGEKQTCFPLGSVVSPPSSNEHLTNETEMIIKQLSDIEETNKNTVPLSKCKSVTDFSCLIDESDGRFKQGGRRSPDLTEDEQRGSGSNHFDVFSIWKTDTGIGNESAFDENETKNDPKEEAKEEKIAERSAESSISPPFTKTHPGFSERKTAQVPTSYRTFSRLSVPTKPLKPPPRKGILKPRRVHFNNMVSVLYPNNVSVEVPSSEIEKKLT